MEPEFFSRIAHLAGGRVFPGVAPEQTAPPYLTYRLVSGARDWTLSGPSGCRRASIQLNAWADTPKEAAQLIGQAFSLISKPGPDFSCAGADDLSAEFEPLAGGLAGAAMEFHLIR